MDKVKPADHINIIISNHLEKKYQSGLIADCQYGACNLVTQFILKLSFQNSSWYQLLDLLRGIFYNAWFYHTPKLFKMMK